MANVDFTLEDIRLVVREEAGQVFEEKFDKKFTEHFKPAFDSAFEPWAMAIQQDFNRMNDRFDHLETNVELLKVDVKGIKRIVSQHSREIIELRARTA